MRARYLFAGCLLVIAGACGDGSPIDPGPVDPGPVVNNTPPVIGKFTVQGTGVRVPPNYADVSDEVPVRVEVTDAESAIGDLKFNWTATVGTFIGTGASVLWKAPPATIAPIGGGTCGQSSGLCGNEVTLVLEVVETYTSQGKPVQNKVTGSTTLMLHDSKKEVGEMARQFLLDFSDSRLSVTHVMRNFDPTEPSCYGTADETSDVTLNRERFVNLSYDIGLPTTTVAFGGTCPRVEKGPRRGDACSLMSARWETQFSIDDPASGHHAGDIFEARGIAQIAAMYYPAQKRWRLCDSTAFEAGNTLGLTLKGLLP